MEDMCFLDVQMLKEFYDSFNISPKIDCKNESLMGMQYECTEGNQNKCLDCEFVYLRYPKIDFNQAVQLITILSCEVGIKPYTKDFESLLDYVLKTLIIKRKVGNVFNRVQQVFL